MAHLDMAWERSKLDDKVELAKYAASCSERSPFGHIQACIYPALGSLPKEKAHERLPGDAKYQFRRDPTLLETEAVCGPNSPSTSLTLCCACSLTVPAHSLCLTLCMCVCVTLC